MPANPRHTPGARTDPRRPRTIVRRLLAWFATQARDLPWRRTRDPYAIWVSEVMLQQTQVATAIPYWQRWMHELPSVSALAAVPLERVLKLWEGLGYYSRARNLHSAAHTLVNSANGELELPTTASGWLALPGIGRYTAGAISSIAFDQPEPVLDGNVIRVLCRLEAVADNPAATATRARLWALAGQLVRAADRERPFFARPCGAFNESLMELGATVCTPGTPHCARCPLATVCKARARGLAGRLPAARSRPQTTRRLRRIFVIEKAGRFQLRQRGAAGGRAGLWEFPGTEDAGAAVSLLDRIAPGATLHSATPWLSFEHSITRYRYRLEVYRARVAGRNSPREPGRCPGPQCACGASPGPSAGSWCHFTSKPFEVSPLHEPGRCPGPQCACGASPDRSAGSWSHFTSKTFEVSPLHEPGRCPGPRCACGASPGRSAGSWSHFTSKTFEVSPSHEPAASPPPPLSSIPNGGEGARIVRRSLGEGARAGEAEPKFKAREQVQKDQGPSRGSGSGPLEKSAGRWVSRAALRALPLSAAHRRIAEALQDKPRDATSPLAPVVGYRP